MEGEGRLAPGARPSNPPPRPWVRCRSLICGFGILLLVFFFNRNESQRDQKTKERNKPKSQKQQQEQLQQQTKTKEAKTTPKNKEINPNRPTWIVLRSRDAQDKINYIHGRHGSRATGSNRDQNGTNKPNVTCPNLNGGAGTRQLRERLHVHVMHACFN